ncbi:outer membrane protein assembly factor BamE [Candidatus Pelagibacter sp.]|nr:outer membrane protein assembly factor BamE [Candidatus Pelagibacter sp.]|tara:strand:+ start:333 stop:779 length:447 start_codon:yes stop_codon:yes gene_type:complete
MKYIYIILLIFIINCTGNKVSNYHGTKSLKKKYELIYINKLNKNDLIKLIGPPSTVSEFNRNKWFYIERLKTNQSLFKLGRQKIKENNILIVEMNPQGIIINKNLLNLNDMNDLKYFKQTTAKEFKNNNVLYNVFSSLREKINAPLRN